LGIVREKIIVIGWKGRKTLNEVKVVICGLCLLGVYQRRRVHTNGLDLLLLFWLRLGFRLPIFQRSS
jgi:hypothetical protein